MRALIMGPGIYGAPFHKHYTCTYHHYPNLDEVPNYDLVVFTGGSDVSPNLYGGRPHYATMSDPVRDEHEIAVYNECIHHFIPMVGICRGAQFLNVMNGGKLHQHQLQHCRGDMHLMYTAHLNLWVTSTHHQLIIPAEDAEILGWADECPQFDLEPEVVFYREARCLCVQYHPEYMGQDSLGWNYFQDLIAKYIMAE